MKVEALRVIEKVASKIAPGWAPSFTEVHVIEVLKTISTRESVGRIKLSEILGLGGGVTRTLVRHLRNEGIIEVWSLEWCSLNLAKNLLGPKV